MFIFKGKNVMNEHSEEAKPATSCHAWWGSPNCNKLDLSEKWEISNSVKVQKSAECTYFCILGFNGTQSGLRQNRNSTIL